MPLAYIDGLEDLSGWTWSSAGGGSGTAAVGAGRNGNGFVLTFGTNNVKAAFPLNLLGVTLSDTVTAGFAYRSSALSSADQNPNLFTLLGDSGSVEHTSIRVAADGSISAHRGSANTTMLGAASVPGVISANTWYFIEVQMKLSDTVGTVVVRVNGTQVINLTAQDTKNGGTGTVYDGVQFGRGTTGNSTFDDLYVQTGAGDSFLGDCTVATLYPTGDGAANQWTGSDGDSVNNWSLVDEAILDQADYVQSSTAGQQDLYAMGDLAIAGTVLGVVHVANVRKTDSGTRTVKLLNRDGGGTISKSATIVPDQTTTPAPIVWALPTDPTDASAWTVAKVNALQSGVEVQ